MNIEYYNPTLWYSVQVPFPVSAKWSPTLAKGPDRHRRRQRERNGTFDRAIASFKAAGVDFAECSGVEPNPRISSVARGADIVRKEGCDVIIAHNSLLSENQTRIAKDRSTRLSSVRLHSNRRVRPGRGIVIRTRRRP